jgi:hypothetical protein
MQLGGATHFCHQGDEMKNDVNIECHIEPNTRPTLTTWKEARSFHRAFWLFLTAVTCFLVCATAAVRAEGEVGKKQNGNTAEGAGALSSLTDKTDGVNNTAIGFDALFKNTSGSYNTANGSNALYNNTSGYDNTASGFEALYSNTTGYLNTATGREALYSNTTGVYNTATGEGALYSNTTGDGNTGNGLFALARNTTGLYNTATGLDALFANTTGNNNTAHGVDALSNNTTGAANTANGGEALYENRTGFYNAAHGYEALSQNQTGNYNTAEGAGALSFNVTGSNNIALGAGAGGSITDENNIDIGNDGVNGDSNTIRIGRPRLPFQHTATFIAGIRNATTGNSDAIPVVVDSSGQLGTISSSQRFKTAVKPIDDSSEAILWLNPVTFQYKKDARGTRQFGLIAEEVAKIDPDLVVRDANGGIYTVRYDAVNAMLLNEFLKEHRRVQEQQREIDRLSAQLTEQATAIHQVRSRLELTQPSVQFANER